jgi:hypothetical protein
MQLRVWRGMPDPEVSEDGGISVDISLGEWTHWALPSSRSRITASTRA